MARKARSPKPKTVSYELIPRDSVIGAPMYTLLDWIVKAHHEDLEYARIALAWCTSWKPDVDGRLTLGRCKRASDLDRELADYDFVILLLRGFWRDERVTETDHQRRALLDHELTHATLKLDANGEPVDDERGRRVYRIRKHDIEEFAAIVERYGTYKTDIENFAAALRRSGYPAFQPCDRCVDLPPMELARARAIADVAKVLVESAKVEVSFLKTTGALKSTDFLPMEDDHAPVRPRLPGRVAAA